MRIRMASVSPPRGHYCDRSLRTASLVHRRSENPVIRHTPFWSVRSQCSASGCCSALRLDHSGVNFSLIKLTPERDCHCPALCPCASPLDSRVSTPNPDTSHTLLLGSFRGTPHRSPQPACSSLCAGSRGTKARARRHLQRVGRLRVSLDRGGAYCA